MKRNMRKLMAYITMPLIFMTVGYLIAAFALTPFYNMGLAVGKMVIAKEKPNFSSNLSSIYSETSNSPGDTVDISLVNIPKYGSHYAQISCSRIGLSAQVYFGDNEEILRRGAGHYIGSLLPGFGGTILMAAHNTTYFLPLKQVQVDDIIKINTNYGDYEYQVTDIQVLHKNDDAFDLAQTEKEQLVLYTCYPFEQIVGIKQQRKFVYADKISGPDVVREDKNG